ncbi:MAG: S-ribosylhomocysteine lyase [Clostridia bacterium]|nr:S-ribosylhomocysteine lyase [Clostridia bacterium]
MKQIASFQIDHDVLTPGMYTSRVDGDIVTYDLRFVRPNTPPFLEVAGMHTMEHLFATYVRSSAFEENIVYFGPMGCRTGFYFLTRGMTHAQAITLTKEALGFIAAYEGAVPGATKIECGNYREHDLTKAREYAAALANVLENWTEKDLIYPSK